MRARSIGPKAGQGGAGARCCWAWCRCCCRCFRPGAGVFWAISAPKKLQKHQKASKKASKSNKKHQKVTNLPKNRHFYPDFTPFRVQKPPFYTVQPELIFYIGVRRRFSKIVSFWGIFRVFSKDPNPNLVKKVCKTGHYVKSDKKVTNLFVAVLGTIRQVYMLISLIN